MDIRTFEAFTMKDAVKSVKKALGADAVILTTREKPAPGGKGKLVEVTAAAGQHAGRRPGATVGVETGGDASVASQLESLSARLTLLADSAAARSQVQALESGMRELKLLVIEALRGKDGSPIQDLPEAAVPIERQLRVMGVDDVSIADLVRQLRALPPPDAALDGEAATQYYRDQAVRWMMKRIKIAPRWSIVPGSVSYQAIVGPTGVGKSTVVAKLAALYTRREKTRVAVVSLDNHRLAAAEQMRVFCKIIGAPFYAVSTAAEIAGLTEANRDVDLVLIDTAGISPKNDAAIAELEQLKSSGIPIDCHLCLAVTEKEAQMDQAVRAFARLGIQSLAFTKLDESWSYGEVYNLSRRWALPLSFFATGQTIPDDLERATRERVVERIFGL